MREIFTIIGKKPEAGYSKTRLSSKLGENAAVRLYDSFIGDFAYRASEGLREDMQIQVFGAPAGPETAKYFSSVFKKRRITYFDQNEVSFFERLKQMVDANLGDFVHMTGTDIPDFPFEVLKCVVPSFETVYIGPDRDGGFYYLGIHQSHSDLLGEIDQREVCDSLVRVCLRRGLKVKILKAWSDIDTVEDLHICLSRTSSEEIPRTYKTYCDIQKKDLAENTAL